jgi:hypothetical protein
VTIWNNGFITVDHRTLYYKNWIERGSSLHLRLAGYRIQGTPISKENLICKTLIRMALLQYERLITATPKSWEKMINDNTNLNRNYHVIKECKILIGKTMTHIAETSSKDVY